MKYSLASGPVIIENNKILLVRHGNTEKERSYWKFPGGKVKPEEITDDTDTLESVCKREAREELGLEIEILMPVKPLLIAHPYKPDEAVVLIHFLARKLNTEIPSREIEECRWFDINKLPESCSPNIKPVIKDYLRIKQQKVAD